MLSVAKSKVLSLHLLYVLYLFKDPKLSFDVYQPETQSKNNKITFTKLQFNLVRKKLFCSTWIWSYILKFETWNEIKFTSNEPKIKKEEKKNLSWSLQLYFSDLFYFIWNNMNAHILFYILIFRGSPDITLSSFW